MRVSNVHLLPACLLACTALFSIAAGVNVMQNAEQRGRAFELAVSAELVQQPGQLFYWLSAMTKWILSTSTAMRCMRSR